MKKPVFKGGALTLRSVVFASTCTNYAVTIPTISKNHNPDTLGIYRAGLHVYLQAY
ncbi:hypothetical protein ACT8ZS_18110 [Paenibacillus sp. M.A.Huq-84]